MFQYMLLLRGATSFSNCSPSSRRFQYMLLLRGATLSFSDIISLICFNTCSSCEEQLQAEQAQYNKRLVSIHAPLARSNFPGRRSRSAERVSIHAPLARSNLRAVSWGVFCMRFNTCSSCEEQPACEFKRSCYFSFQYMLLLRGATGWIVSSDEAFGFQYMLLLRGATRSGLRVQIRAVFQYMLLLRGATI